MNLLSKDQKDALRKDILARFFGVALATLALWGAMFLIFAYTSALYLEVQIPALEERLKNEQRSETSRSLTLVEEEIIKLNAALFDIEKAKNRKSVYSPAILRKIGELVPEGVMLKRLSFKGQSVTLEGQAEQRSDALVFKGKLEKDSICQKLSSPLIVKEKNVDFNFTCAMAPR
ncbi:MAG: PilN domain-containing protein [Candidatus Spechtbacteria bacterium]|nr:PilN domain-containing protein [Candidatus Spechtbacteria bacterium]